MENFGKAWCVIVLQRKQTRLEALEKTVVETTQFFLSHNKGIFLIRRSVDKVN